MNFTCPNCDSTNLNRRLNKCFDCNFYYDACMICGHPDIFHENSDGQLFCERCIKHDKSYKKKRKVVPEDFQ